MIKTRFLLLSDTHGRAPLPSTDKKFAFRHPLPSADVLLHAGDLTELGKQSEHQVTFDMVKAINAELKIVIAGNHDLTLDEEFWGEFISEERLNCEKAKELWTGEEARNAGIVYLEEGVRMFKLRSGAVFTIYASPYTPEYGNWAFPYTRSEDRFGPLAQNPIPSHPAIDIVLTHGPPSGILDRTFTEEDAGCEHLLSALRRVRPRLHVFGHIHEGRGAVRQDWDKKEGEELVTDMEKDGKNGGTFLDVSSGGGKELKWGKETLFVNAAIMTLFQKPWYAPWVVDLDLPVRQEGASDEQIC